MDKVIWKFPLKVTDHQDIVMPKGSIILSVQVQHGTPCLWALINNPEADKEVIQIVTYGTEVATTEAIDRYGFIGSYQLDSGIFVGHVFIKPPTPHTP